MGMCSMAFLTLAVTNEGGHERIVSGHNMCSVTCDIFRMSD
jgi:hypothetical protein